MLDKRRALIVSSGRRSQLRDNSGPGQSLASTGLQSAAREGRYRLLTGYRQLAFMAFDP